MHTAVAKALTTHHTNNSTLTDVELKHLEKSFHDRANDHFAKSLRQNPIEENEDIDRIQRYLQHLEYCCQIYSGFDIYQILAFRRLHEKSRKYTKTKPFKLLGWKWETRLHSPYSDSVLTAVVIGLLQVVGITVILSQTITSYFESNEGEAQCEYDLEFWIDDGILKILAFLFAAMISIQLNKSIQSQRHSGFNELLSSIPEKDFGKLHFVDISLIQLGLLVNVYTLFCAVVGSFFLIYASEGGAQALDMVLNSITLFFMVGLDDLLVSPVDYDDVEEFIVGCYDHYMTDRDSFEDDIEKQICGYQGLIACDRFVDLIQFVLVTLTYIISIIGPFLIAICW